MGLPEGHVHVSIHYMILTKGNIHRAAVYAETPYSLCCQMNHWNYHTFWFTDKYLLRDAEIPELPLPTIILHHIWLKIWNCLIACDCNNRNHQKKSILSFLGTCNYISVPLYIMHQRMTDHFWLMLLWNWNSYLLSSLTETVKTYLSIL